MERIITVSEEWVADIPRGTVVRIVDNESKEEGYYFAIDSVIITGRASGNMFTKTIYAYQIDTSGDEPILTKDIFEIKPQQKLKIIGKYKLDE